MCFRSSGALMESALGTTPHEPSRSGPGWSDNSTMTQGQKQMSASIQHRQQSIKAEHASRGCGPLSISESSPSASTGLPHRPDVPHQLPLRLLQPDPQPLHPRLPLTRRLRDHRRGMITTPTPSVERGSLQSDFARRVGVSAQQFGGAGDGSMWAGLLDLRVAVGETNLGATEAPAPRSVPHLVQEPSGLLRSPEEPSAWGSPAPRGRCREAASPLSREALDCSQRW